MSRPSAPVSSNRPVVRPAPGLAGYALAAPTYPHLGWTPSQVNAATNGTGRPYVDVIRNVDSYNVPTRGLNQIPGSVLHDSSVRLNHYLKPIEANQSRRTGDWHNTGRESARVAGGWLGAMGAGALVGAASGSIVPVIGNVGGFVVGAVAGASGYWLGSQAGEASYEAAF